MESDKKSNSPFEVEQLAKTLMNQAISSSSTPPASNPNHFVAANFPTIARPKTKHQNAAKKMAGSKSVTTLQTPSSTTATTEVAATKLILIFHGH